MWGTTLEAPYARRDMCGMTQGAFFGPNSSLARGKCRGGSKLFASVVRDDGEARAQCNRGGRACSLSGLWSLRIANLVGWGWYRAMLRDDNCEKRQICQQICAASFSSSHCGIQQIYAASFFSSNCGVRIMICDMSRLMVHV